MPGHELQHRSLTVVEEHVDVAYSHRGNIKKKRSSLHPGHRVGHDPTGHRDLHIVGPRTICVALLPLDPSAFKLSREHVETLGWMLRKHGRYPSWYKDVASRLTCKVPLYEVG